MKLSDVERKPPDILSDQSETEIYDPSVLVSDRTVALSDVNQNVPLPRTRGLYVKYGKSEYYCIKGELEMLF